MGYSGTSGINQLIADRFPWICAVWLHLGLFAVFANLVVQDRITAPLQEAISVELFTQRPMSPASHSPDRPWDRSAALQALNAQEKTSEGAPPGLTEPEIASRSETENRAGVANADEPVWISATDFHAQDVLNDPRSTQARLALATLAGGDRREQLCALEAMEQVRRTQPGFRPTRLAPHAFRNSVQRNDEIIAPAGAVRSNRVWYEIAYRCGLNADGKKIESFEFSLGEPIDRSLWDQHGLAPIH